MGGRRVQGSLFLFLLGVSAWTLAQKLQCQTSRVLSTKEDPVKSFNWTSEKVETCDNGAFCQETVILIKAGDKFAVIATKSCISEGSEAVTFIQHSSPPGLSASSYSNFCPEPLCNSMKNVSQFWRVQETPDSMSTALRCPTCVAVGGCAIAPSRPCPNGTSRCYQGKIELIGGGVNTTVEVKGCSAMTRCRVMAGIVAVGPIQVKETCRHQPLFQPRKAESRAAWLLTSLWVLELLLPLLLLPLAHCL